MLTKEKVLAGMCGVVALLVVSQALQRPRLEEVPTIPPEEAARHYSASSATPRLTPEGGLDLLRDPFRAPDPWQEPQAPPLDLPASPPWPRALPGGLSSTALAPGDRLLVVSDPAPPPPPPADKGGQKE